MPENNQNIDQLLHHLHSLSIMGYDYLEDFSLHQIRMPQKLVLPSQYSELKSVALNCNLCSLCKSRSNVLFGTGSLQSNVMIILDSVSKSQDKKGGFYLDDAQKSLREFIENDLNLSLHNIYMTSLVKCFSNNDQGISEDVMSLCKDYVLKEIELISPKLIIALGDLSYKYIVETIEHSLFDRGQVISLGSMSWITTFHPDFIVRNPSFRKEYSHHIRKIKSLLECL